MANFEKFIVFDSRSIVHQKVEKVINSNIPDNLEGQVYGITIKLNNGDELYYQLTEDDYFNFLGWNSWNNGNIYVVYLENHVDKWFSSYQSLQKFIQL